MIKLISIVIYRVTLNKNGGILKKIYYLIGLVVMIVALLMIRKSNPLEKVKSYKIFYGRPNNEIMKHYKLYDLIILETDFYSKKQIESINKEAKTVGYLSVMEIPTWDQAYVKKINSDLYLEVNGKKIINKMYDNYVGDISKSEYRELLHERVKVKIISKQLDGIFFDTVDWIESFDKNPNISKKLREGYIIFLQELKEKYPELIMIQNRGIGIFDSYSYKLVDGVMWENFNQNDMFRKNKSITIKLIKRQILNSTKIFTVSHNSKLNDRRILKFLKWLHADSNGSYSSWE